MIPKCSIIEFKSMTYTFLARCHEYCMIAMISIIFEKSLMLTAGREIIQSFHFSPAPSSRLSKYGWMDSRCQNQSIRIHHMLAAFDFSKSSGRPTLQHSNEYKDYINSKSACVSNVRAAVNNCYRPAIVQHNFVTSCFTASPAC